MLSKIKEFLDKDSNYIKDCLDVGIVPYNNLIDNFEQLNIVYKDLNNVIQALIADNIEYLKPLLVMTKENDFRRKTILITVKNELCTGCSGCAFICPALAIEMKNTRPNLDLKKCIHCGSCFVICPKSWNLHEEVEAWF